MKTLFIESDLKDACREATELVNEADKLLSEALNSVLLFKQEITGRLTEAVERYNSAMEIFEEIEGFTDNEEINCLCKEIAETLIKQAVVCESLCMLINGFMDLITKQMRTCDVA